MNGSMYEDYMRSVLGYDSMNYRNTYDNYDSFAVPTMSPMSNMQNEELERCYPDIYRIVYPMVQNACMRNTRQVTSELVDTMTDEIYFAVEDNDLVEDRSSKESKSAEDKEENRQSIIRNRTLRDLIRILLLRELLGRPGFPGFPGRPPRPRPPMRPPIRPPMRPGPGPRPGMGGFNRQSYNSFDNEYDLYEY